MAIDFQSGIRRFNGSLKEYTGMVGGLTADYHTLRALNPLTTNRVRIVMYRAPLFMMKYFGGDTTNYYSNPEVATYRKALEYFNTGITCNIGDATLATAPLQGGFAGRQLNIPTTQNAQTGQTLTVQVPEWVGRPIANFHNMWVNGISDKITGLTTYHGLVSGGVDQAGNPQRIFYQKTGDTDGLDPSPAWEVAEFLVIALDRSGARVEAAAMALGCFPASEIGNDIFNMNATGNSQIQTLNITFNCQYIQSAYVNDLAARYARQFANFGNAFNLNPGAGDAFFRSANSIRIDTDQFNNGNRPTGDAVQSAVGNAPVFQANPQFAPTQFQTKTLDPNDHFVIHTDPMVQNGATQNIKDLADQASAGS
jgi:hypothetical protein